MGRAEERKGSNIYIQGARVPVYQELIVHYDSSWWNGKSEEPSLLFVDSMMNGKQSLTSRFNILSQKVQGLTPEKEDILLELMDQLHLDLVFIPKTFRQPFQGSDTQSVQFISRAGYSILEYVNPNQRRGIQFGVTSYLEPVLVQSFCQNSGIPEILAMQVQNMILLWTYIPDGRS